MSDERDGLPSASGVESMQLCKGKFALESRIPHTDDSSEESRSGDRIHAYMALSAEACHSPEELPKLDDDEERVAEKFAREEAELVATLIGEPLITLREERLWLNEFLEADAPACYELRRIFSGKPDAVFVGEDAILIVDYKSGFLGATEAPRNPQLRALVVLVAAKFSPMGRPIYVAVLLRAGRPSVARYEVADIAAAEAELRAVLVSGTDPLAPRAPSDKACKYCRAAAAGVCPEANAVPAMLAVLDMRHELATDDLLRLLDACGPAEKVIGSLRAEAKRRIERDPASVPGWELTEGQRREKVVDVQTLAARVFALGVPVEDFTKACSISKKALEPLVKEATKTKGAGLKAKMNEALAGLTETTVTAPSLKRSTDANPQPALE